MKKVAVHYISGILAVVCFVIFAVSAHSGKTIEQCAPLMVVFLICSVIHNMTRHAQRQAARELYNQMRNSYETVHSQTEERVGLTDVQHLETWQTAENARLAAEDAMRAAENARLDNTGIEFGGRNTDPNLNPSMHFEQDSMMNTNFFNNQ